MSRYLMALDQSTSATKALLVDRTGRVKMRVSYPHRQYYPFPGWAEHDATEIWHNAEKCLQTFLNEVPLSDIAAVAISNQRETTVLWDRRTGEPICPAVVWQDVRAEALCKTLSDAAAVVRRKTGLTLSPYYPAMKAMHVLQRLPAPDGLCVGTMDSWLIFKMCGRFVTDHTNASRTQLMNLRTLFWDDELIALFGLKPRMLAEQILPCDAAFGNWRGIPIVSAMGDSHASLFGQGCVREKDAKATYGTGSSVMMNTGTDIRLSDGLQTCVAFSRGGNVNYALEGNVTCSGDALVFLKDVGFFESADEIERLAARVDSPGGVVLVPAFSGLGAPYFAPDARGALLGLSRGTTKNQVAYAALLSIAHQITDIAEVMAGVNELKADGGASKNAVLMQMQADLLCCPVARSACADMSPLGAAYMGGQAIGFFDAETRLDARAEDTFVPRMERRTRDQMRADWKNAVCAVRSAGTQR